jgi:hypothetical protein
MRVVERRMEAPFLIFTKMGPSFMKRDELVKSLKTLFPVIPVKTGIQSFQ